MISYERYYEPTTMRFPEYNIFSFLFVTRKAAIVFMCFMTFYYVKLYRGVDVSSQRRREIEYISNYSSIRGGLQNNTDDYHRVLFFSYIRGGSSIGSEIFDLDNRSVFWYEPLDSFYFSTSGYFGRKCQKVYMDEEETKLRPLQQWEVDQLIEFMRNVYDCRLDALPSESRLHRFLMHSSAFKSYTSCYEHNSADSIIWDLIYCRRMLQTVCGMSVETSINMGCPELMHSIHMASNINMTNPSRISNHQLSETDQANIIKYHLNQSGYNVSQLREAFSDVVAYRTCLDDLEEISAQCLPFAVDACPKRKIRAAKIVRATMQPVASLIENIPGLKVIMFVRDPRAVAFSRSSNAKPKNQVLRNFLKLCMKMRADLYYKQQVERFFPQSILIVRYEDFVTEPFRWINIMYAHIGLEAPAITSEFVKTHLYAGKDDGRKFGDVRANATVIANRWRALVAPDLMFKMQQACPDILQSLGYPFLQ